MQRGPVDGLLTDTGDKGHVKERTGRWKSVDQERRRASFHSNWNEAVPDRLEGVSLEQAGKDLGSSQGS